jgi:L,D-peptidoglycan transpeptidase YkuD (ErfK/YbiS/YcfS/YnhG family)
MAKGRAVHHLMVRVLNVRVLNARATRGFLDAGGLRVACAIGRSGISWRKREGDGATPAGRWPLRTVMMRVDRRNALSARGPLGVAPIGAQDGWCDAPGDRNYNRRVQHPYPASAERLWRDDGLYDVIVVLGYNERPRVQGKGSAIFLHCARGDYQPTEGCIAVAKRDLLRLLPRLSRKTALVTGNKNARL